MTKNEGFKVVLSSFFVGAVFAFYDDSNVSHELPRLDGWYNNLARPWWGTPGQRLIRQVPPAYSDGVYAYSGLDRPHPRDISYKTMRGPSGIPSYMNRTVMLTMYGQVLVLELMKSVVPACPRELVPIKITKCDPEYDWNCTGTKKIPFLRAKFDKKTGLSPGVPREQINGVTSWLDASAVYSFKKPWSDALREFKDGRLKSRDRGKWPPINTPNLPFANPAPSRQHVRLPRERQWMLGDVRMFQHPGLLSLGVMYFRYHNYMAEKFKHMHPHWDDEEIFQTAKKWVVAVFQKIAVYDFYPAFTNDTLPEYTGYKPSVNPGISHMFQAVAFRLGHSLIPPGYYRRTGECKFMKTTKRTVFEDKPAVRLCNTWFNADEAMEFGLEPFLLGMASQITEREDHILVDDVRGKLFGPLQHSRRDLALLNIIRGRDSGIPDYNVARRYFSLPEITKWEDINPEVYKNEPMVIERLKEVHMGNISRLDAFVGGIFETVPAGPGPLFLAVLRDQFERLRDADRFWFENRQNRFFTEKEIAEIKSITLYDIITNVTDVKPDQLQRDVFFWKDGDPCPQPKQLEASDMEECDENQGYDYFTGSEIAYIAVPAGLGAVPIVCLIIIFCLQHQRTKEIKADKKHAVEQTASASMLAKDLEGTFMKRKGEEAMIAIERYGPRQSQWVIIEVEETETEAELLLFSTHGKLIRLVNLLRGYPIRQVISNDDGKRTLLLRVKNEADIVLQFDHARKRAELSSRLAKIASRHNYDHHESAMPVRNLVKLAETREERKEKVATFLKNIFAELYSEKGKLKTGLAKLKKKERNQLLDMEISRMEFAEALDLTDNSTFVNDIFSMADKYGKGFISFRQFLDIMIILFKGSEDEKEKMIFNIYDVDGKGAINREEFIKLVRSMLNLLDTSIAEREFNEMINSMFDTARLTGKGHDQLTFEDFKRLMASDKKEDRIRQIVRKYDLVHQDENSNPIASTPRSPPEVNNNETAFKYTSKVENRKRSVDRLKVSMEQKDYSTNQLVIAYKIMKKYIDNKSQEIFYLTMFLTITAALFIERSVRYAIIWEHAGIRRLTGHGVTVTRGLATAMSFTYACVMLSMCRNTIHKLRTTFVGQFVPLDSAFEFHKIAATISIILSMSHMIGHCFNFYHLSTQPPDYTECVFMTTMHFRTDFLTTFQFWLFQTVTGATGVLLTIVVSIVAMFSWFRTKVYNVFWKIHTSYILVYFLLILHGSAVLVQEPWFYFFFIAPCILFAFDKLFSFSRQSIPMKVRRAELLPSSVLYLEVKRPADFHFEAGQYTNIAIKGFHEQEFHPFTITSAPSDEVLKFHIRAVGPWTSKVRDIYDKAKHEYKPLPKLIIDGPFGNVAEEWYKYEVCVMVAGGIGITPYASILKHLIYLSQIHAKIPTEKIYFIWVTSTQRQFEWFTDILKEMEDSDLNELMQAYLFITQFYQKYDFRTVMLYLCEKHFVKVADRSLFSGLRAPTNFGRPDFNSLLKSVANNHPGVKKIGVFSCGPASLIKSVSNGCFERNKKSDIIYEHYAQKY